MTKRRPRASAGWPRKAPARNSRAAEPFDVASPRTAPAYFRGGRRDSGAGPFYIGVMRALIVIALFAVLAASVWFAGAAWERFGGDAIPLYGYVAIAGGVLFSLLIGGGLMALVFYSNLHGYDDLSGGDGERG